MSICLLIPAPQPRIFARCAIALLIALVSCTAQAACFAYSDPRLATLDKLMRTDPKAVQQQIKRELQSETLRDVGYRLASYALLTEAYSIQEQHEDVRDTVERGIELATDTSNPSYLNLLFLDATRPLEQAEISTRIKRTEAILKDQVSGSAAEACAMITLGVLEYVSDRTDLASMYLTRAYRMSAGPERVHQRMAAAGVLSLVMQALRDFPAALALSQEVIDWHTQRQSIVDLSAAYFIHGYIHTELGDPAAARAALESSRSLSLELNGTPTAAYADLLICSVDIDLAEPARARGHCENALRTFTDAGANEPRKQALTSLAEIHLMEGHPRLALEKLNRVLDFDGADLPPFRVAQIYELRARAHRELGQYRASLEDYENFMARFKANKEDERAREAAAMRARFDTDREIERNAFLKRELGGKSARLEAQSARLHWMIAAALTSVLGIVLLTFLLLANKKKKSLLARLAGEDELTGLANRRFTLESARRTWHRLAEGGKPLTIAILDLDHFKRINDRFGHAAGDYVLKEFARLARDHVRESDVLGRWGGEEFLLVLPNTPLDIALGVVERVRSAAMMIGGGPLPSDYRVTLSAGLATNEGRVAQLEEAIAQADSALYRAKDRGRNLVQVAQESYDIAAPNIRSNLKAAGVDLKTGRFSIAS